MRKLYCFITVLFFSLNAFAQTVDTVSRNTTAKKWYVNVDNDTAKRAVIINGNQEHKPLILIDGAVFKGNISDLDPNNISEINVVRDTNYVKVYGKAGANGIIIITTKGHTSIYKPEKKGTDYQSGLPDDAMYVIDGAMSDKKLEGINPNDILSIQVLKDNKAVEPMEGSDGRATVIIITKSGAIKSYKKKFSEFSPKYKAYLESHGGDDSGLHYSIDGYDCDNGMDGITRLHTLARENLSKIKISTEGDLTKVAITTKSKN